MRFWRRIEPGLSASASSNATPAQRDRVNKSGPPGAGVAARLIAVVVIGVTAYGFINRDENWITPEHGLGYIFGIAGSALILILLSYSLRKRLRWMRGWGRLPGWLKFHMLLGVLGPTLILFHANFRLGATNSTVALVTMLTVMGSGIVGRFFYGKTHHRLSGELRSLEELRDDTQSAREELHLDFTNLPELRRQLDEFESRILDPGHGVLSSTRLYLDFALSKGSYRRRLLKMVGDAIGEEGARRGLDSPHTQPQLKAAKNYLTLYFQRLQHAAEFRFYERVFSLWHVLHVPLLFLLITAALVHIVAVHLY